jgi:hypothetical protein
VEEVVAVADSQRLLAVVAPLAAEVLSALAPASVVQPAGQSLTEVLEVQSCSSRQKAIALCAA